MKPGVRDEARLADEDLDRERVRLPMGRQVRRADGAGVEHAPEKAVTQDMHTRIRRGRDAVRRARNDLRIQAEEQRLWRECELARGVAEAHAERVGPQLLLLRRELEKAALVAGPGQKLEVAHVAEAVGVSAEEPIWDLTDAIGTGRVADALAVLGRLEANGAPGPVLLGTLASHFRKLARVRAGGKVAGHPFAVRKLEEQARRYSLPGLRSCLRSIHDTDEALKGRGDLPADLALERLVIHLAG